MDSLRQRLQNAYTLLLDSGEIHNRVQFGERIRKTKSQISDAFKDRPGYCTLGLMKAIADTFPDVLNRDYLLTGEGEVAVPDKTMRPHFDTKASAGFMCEISEGIVGQMRPRIPNVKDYDFTIEAEGDSMLPRIETGDLLVCRKSSDRANPPIGKICVIDGKDGAAVKVVMTADEESITLHSLNPSYPDYSVNLSDVLNIAEVVGLVRKF